MAPAQQPLPRDLGRRGGASSPGDGLVGGLRRGGLGAGASAAPRPTGGAPLALGDRHRRGDGAARLLSVSDGSLGDWTDGGLCSVVGVAGTGAPGLAMVAGLHRQWSDRRGGDLSGGQQQQLAIGRALVLDPTVLILDEPTEGIQPNIVREIGDTIMRLNRDDGMTVLLVEQKLPLARRVADRFHVLDKGRAVAGGPMEALDDEIVRRYLTV